MRVRILGTRGEVESSAPRHSRRSGVLINDALLLDLGEKAFLDHRPAAVFITHLHPDHAFFMRRRGQSLETDIPVYAPQRSTVAPSVRPAPAVSEVAGLRVSRIPVSHSLRVKSVAYMVEELASGRRLLYTGDVVSINRRWLPRVGRVDLVITDGSFLRRGGLVRADASGAPFGHAGIPDLVELFAPLARLIVFTHFGEWFYRDVPRSRRQILRLSTSPPTLPAYDNLLLTL